MDISEFDCRLFDTTNTLLGEGPTYDPETDTAWWFDISARKLLERPLGAERAIVHDLPLMGSALAAIDSERQLLVAEDGLYVRARGDGSLSQLLGSATIEFATSSAQIGASSDPLLDSVAEAASTCPGTLRIEGHTDNTGEAAFNEELSRKRAESVRAALVQRGLSGNRLVAQGYGARKPIADNRTAAGRAHNRRIEIRVVRASD